MNVSRREKQYLGQLLKKLIIKSLQRVLLILESAVFKITELN